MPCYRPLQAWRSRQPSSKGGLSITFIRAEAYLDMEVSLPCGQCIGCRLERSRQWAMRCMFEAEMHIDNCFLTLTYDDDHIPHDWSLQKPDHQKFMKRLRKSRGEEAPKIKFYHCGEYGDKYGRPHFHYCIFGHDFEDKVLHSYSGRDQLPIYTSEKLSLLWPSGLATIGEVTFESASYCARYVVDKITGKPAEAHYGDRLPEYQSQSHGVGTAFYDLWKDDFYPHDYVVVNGKKMQPPKFYDRLYEIEDEKSFREIVSQRKRSANKHSENNTKERLAVREIVHNRKLEQLVRKHDDY